MREGGGWSLPATPHTGGGEGSSSHSCLGVWGGKPVEFYVSQGELERMSIVAKPRRTRGATSVGRGSMDGGGLEGEEHSRGVIARLKRNIGEYARGDTASPI